MVPVESVDLDADGGSSSISIDDRSPILKTKLFLPPPPANRTPRGRLYEHLNRGLEKTLTLVIAPAGYGKTTLVSSWLREANLVSTWLSLDEDDNDPIRFLQYLISALHGIHPDVSLDLMGVLQGKQGNPFVVLMNILINQIMENPQPSVLVLDDFHILQSQTVLELFAYLVDHAPPCFHIFLLSRADPPLPTARLRARGQLLEIRADQLRFTDEEAGHFLNQAMGLRLAVGDISALQNRTEGWIAGLQLAGVSLSSVTDSHAFVSAFTGSHHYVMDYLVAEVLKLQPPEIRSFLLQTSILDRMCGPLCDAVVDPAPTGLNHGQEMLEALHQLGLFVIPLDNERRWYRYHHLFADVLYRWLEQSKPELPSILHQRASGWFERSGSFFDAIRHSLLAGDRDEAARLVSQNGCQLLISGEITTLLHWIESVDSYSRQLPWIAIQKGWALALSGKFDQAEAPLHLAAQVIETLPPSDEVSTMSGTVTAAHALVANMRGDTRLAAATANRALETLPASTDFSCALRSVAISLLGDSSWLEGQLDQAQSAYTESVKIGRAAGNNHMVIISSCNLADVLLEQGHLRQAARILTEAVEIARLPDGRYSPLAERAFIGLGSIYLEWDRLDEVENCIRTIFDLARHSGNTETEISGSILLIDLEHARGRTQSASEIARSVEQQIDEHSIVSWRQASFLVSLARFAIARGDLEKASRLINESGFPAVNGFTEENIPFAQEPVYVAWLRLLLARGDLEEALALSDRLVQVLDARNHQRRLLEATMLRSIVLYQTKNTTQAEEVLSAAVNLAQPEGCLRVFLNQGDLLTKILYQLRLHHPDSTYLNDLLSLSGHLSQPASLLVSPLTPRELEIFRLIENGCSNQEIADKFYISLPTVKRHISNIYAKLGAGSRTQAVAIGKKLNLFDKPN